MPWFLACVHGIAQSFNQALLDGSPATITLSGVDGLVGDVVYIREDLLRQYVADRAIVWFAFGERELRPYPPSPPQWLVDAQRQQENAWGDVLTEADLKQSAKSLGKKKAIKRQPARARAAKKSLAKKVPSQAGPKTGRRARRKS